MKEHSLIFSGESVRAILDGRKVMTRRIVTPHNIRFVGMKGVRKPSPEMLAQAFTDVEAMRQFGPGMFTWQGKAYEYQAPAQKTSWVAEPIWQPGDRIWVKEAWADTNGESGPMISYRASGDRFLTDECYPVDYSRYPNCQFTMWCGDLRRGEDGHAWRSPLFMPRWASRITLEVVEVRLERLQNITEADAVAEGCSPSHWRHEDGPKPEAGLPHSYAVERYRRLWESINGKGSWDLNPWVWAITFRRLP